MEEEWNEGRKEWNGMEEGKDGQDKYGKEGETNEEELIGIVKRLGTCRC